METQRQGPIIFSGIAPDEGLKAALGQSRADVIGEVRNSQIKGRGGAGFPTGVKWNLAATAQGERKFIVCNADEGEPGTFKDRVLLKEYARTVFEGMVIAGYAVGAQHGYVYLRGEYRSFGPHLEQVLQQMEDEGALGDAILGKKDFHFDIEIRFGVGAYVCGEESALIESLEGYRGEARNRPPFPTNTGLHGSPTVVNNVETFAAVPHIIAKGAEWFASFGTEKSKGSKLLSVSGDCRKPGVYEVPFGTSIKQILKMVEAEDTKAVQVGGASGTCVPKKEFGRVIAYEDLSTGGSVIVFNSRRSLIDVVHNFLEFFAEESCGQCTPCREGVPVLLEYAEKLRAGELTRNELGEVYSLSETMQLASKCGLGQSAPNALVSILEKFPKECPLSTSQRKELVR
ncbi:MAG: dehydrogenase [Candidatus Omnitrophica bacterium]|nr:dehydrogenase [Candidatus Omnitrophota bacterium]